MFGNRLGWGLSVVIYVLAGSFLWFLHTRGTTMIEPTAVGRAAATFTMKLEIDPRSIATWMTDEGSGVDAYREAIDAYQKDAQAYEIYIERGRLDTPEFQRIQPGLQALLKARTMKGKGVFVDRPGAVITYDSDRPELKEALYALRKVAEKVGKQLEVSGQKAKAREAYQAIFTLGTKLWEERFAYDEMFEARQGLAVARWLAESTDESAERGQLMAFESQFITFFKKHVDPPHKALAAAYPHIGDAVALARNGGDRMWRVQGTLALGRCKFIADPEDKGTKSESRIDARVQAELERLAADGDPQVALAARLAKELTVEQFRILRGPL